MGFLKKKLVESVSRSSGEPTDSPMFGAFMDGETLKMVAESGIVSWACKRPGASAEVDEDHYPDAWRAGRELARGRYAQRLKNVDPIPKGDEATARVALHEGIALQSPLITSLQFAVKEGTFKADDADTGAIKACCISYTHQLRQLFTDHWS